MECDSYRTWQSSNRAVYTVQQKLLNISKVDGQRSAVVRGVVRLSELWNGWADGGSTACRPLSVATSSECRNRSSQRDCRQRQRQQLKSAVPLSRRPKFCSCYIKANRLGIEPATCKSQVQHPTAQLPCNSDAVTTIRHTAKSITNCISPVQIIIMPYNIAT